MKRAAARKPPEDLVETFDEVEQGSDAWNDLRLGLPTASRFGAIMAEGKDGGESKTRAKLLRLLAAEIIFGRTMETFSNDDMARGVAQEPEALRYYAASRFVEVARVGFIRRTFNDPLAANPLVIGCSPDGLVDADGIVQTKSMRPDLIVELVDSGRQPTEHRAQCQGEMLVSGRAWCDLMYSYEGFPIRPTFRLERDEDYIGRRLRPALEVFAYDLRKLVERVRQKGGVR